MTVCRAVVTHVRTRPEAMSATYLRRLSSKSEIEIQYNGVRVQPYCTADKYVETHGNRQEISEKFSHRNYKITTTNVWGIYTHRDMCERNEIDVYTAVAQ